MAHFPKKVRVQARGKTPGSGSGNGQPITLENGLKLGQDGGISGVGLGVKGPVGGLSDQPVLKVTGSNIGYLRLLVGETYTGNSWLSPNEASQSIQAGAVIPFPPFRRDNAYATAQIKATPILPLGKGPIAVSLYASKPQGGREFRFSLSSYQLSYPDDLKDGYTWQSLVPVVPPENLRKSRTITVSSSLLQLPASLPQRVRDLAQKITAGKTNEYDKLDAIIAYLRGYTYDLDNAATPPGRDGVDFFLFDDKRGVCSTFSSAFAVLARASGIPARVVGGWAIAATPQEQIVQAKQGHQWAEVPFEGLGWVTFEATVGGATSRVPGQTPPPTPTPAPKPPENQKQEEDKPILDKTLILEEKLAAEGGMPPHIPLFDVTGAAHTSYLRNTATMAYSGGYWEPDPNQKRIQYTGNRLVPPAKGYKSQSTDTISLELLGKPSGRPSPLLTSLYPISVSGPLPLLFSVRDQTFFSTTGVPQQYTFDTAHYDYDRSMLLGAMLESDPDYLQLPPTVTARTRQLAQTIVGKAQTPYEKARAIESYLKSNYKYDFDFRKAPPGQDPVDWFLFEEKRGVCGNFNSAFVVLSRTLGIPARLVGGYRISAKPEKQTVYADQAHAWSEVEFNVLGWLTFDATGYYRPVATQTEITVMPERIEKGHSFQIQGEVKSDNLTVEGTLVQVFINSKKDKEGGLQIGEGLVSKGVFKIDALIPKETDLGDYQVLAHSLV